jgi:hypothetical protein
VRSELHSAGQIGRRHPDGSHFHCKYKFFISTKSKVLYSCHHRWPQPISFVSKFKSIYMSLSLFLYFFNVPFGIIQSITFTTASHNFRRGDPHQSTLQTISAIEFLLNFMMYKFTIFNGHIHSMAIYNALRAVLTLLTVNICVFIHFITFISNRNPLFFNANIIRNQPNSPNLTLFNPIHQTEVNWSSISPIGQISLIGPISLIGQIGLSVLSVVSALDSWCAALSSRFSVLGSQFSVLDSQFSILSSQFSVGCKCKKSR